MRGAKRTAAPADELRRLLNTNYTDGDAGLRLDYSGCRKAVVENGVALCIREARHCHKDGTVTVRRWCSTEKRKPRRKRRGNHRMRRALIRQRKGR